MADYVCWEYECEWKNAGGIKKLKRFTSKVHELVVGNSKRRIVFLVVERRSTEGVE